MARAPTPQKAFLAVAPRTVFAAIVSAHASCPASSQDRTTPSVAAAMDAGHHRGGGAVDADFVGLGFALVLSAVSYLNAVIGGGGGTPLPPGMEWQVILAFAVMAGGLLLIMHGVRARGARPPVVVRRIADAASVVLWHAGGPERLLGVVVLVLLPLLEAWFDLF